jgi:PAS domain S-box-containing protein
LAFSAWLSSGRAEVGFGQRLAATWLERALGELIVAPALLVVVTPWLVRRGSIAAEAPAWGERPREWAPAPRWGDWVEIGGLAAGAALLCVTLTWLHGQRGQLGWQLWGAPLLLIVWAGLRQGPRGGVLTAAVASAAPLLALPVRSYRPGDAPLFAFLLQGHLLAQCCAALLVAASIVWVRARELAYRQVVAHVPVVIYSARINPQKDEERPGPFGLPPAQPEVTLVSAASAALLGCAPEQLVGDYGRWLEHVHAGDREVVLAALAQLARQEGPVTCEYRRGPPPGAGGADGGPPAVCWLRDTLAPHRAADGRLTGWEGVVSDITEQRTLADDLRRTTSMFNALVSNLPAGVFFIQGPHGTPILVNARARQLLGQREDSAAGLEHLAKVYRLFRPDGTPYPVEDLPVYQALRHGRATMRDDIVVHRPDGRLAPLVSWAAPVDLVGRDGRAEAAVWVLEDRTPLQRAEAARQDSEGRLRAVIETMAEGLVVQDRKGRIVDGNPAACALFGRPPEGLGGRSLFELGWSSVREDGAPLPREEHPAEAALRGGRPVRNVVLGLCPALSAPPARWVLVNAMPLPAGAGVVTTLSDITAYVHAREAIRTSEAAYRGLVESLPLMVIQSDLSQRVTYVNPALRAITGYEAEQIADPAVWSSLIHPEDLPRAQALVQAALAGQSSRAEFRYRAKDGSEKVAFALAQPRWQDGRVAGATTLLVDRTRERQLERELLRSQRLELVGRLASGVAHDFNNLLSVVLALVDLARGHLPAEHAAHADLRRISEAGEQAASLAGQLLALSKQRRLPAQRVEVNRVVRRTLELLRATLPRNLQVEVDLGTGALFVLADETQVQQVLMNLCLNARDAMPGGGRLQVRTSQEPGDGAAGPAQVRLSVRDSGTGMSEQVRAHIFEPFFSTKEGGTGLGLAVVQQIVESYGGRVEVCSEPGRGTCFDVWWPAAANG